MLALPPLKSVPVASSPSTLSSHDGAVDAGGHFCCISLDLREATYSLRNRCRLCVINIY